MRMRRGFKSTSRHAYEPFKKPKYLFHSNLKENGDCNQICHFIVVCVINYPTYLHKHISSLMA